MLRLLVLEVSSVFLISLRLNVGCVVRWCVSCRLVFVSFELFISC